MSQLLQYYKSFQQSRQAAATFAPTFEDLTIDDSLTELQRLVKYAKSSIGLQRLVHVKMFAYVSSNQSIDVVISQIVPLLDIYSKDTEPAVRHNLVEQMVPFAKYCIGQGIPGYRILIDYILPTTSRMLEDVKPEIRHTASTALVEVSKLVKPEDLGQYVLTIVLRLAHEDEKEEMRMTASELLNMLAECFGQDLCRQFVIPEVVSLAEDPVFRVRKSTALNFHMICKIGGEHELFERLMPAFVRLSKDDMYRVRRACADSLSDISKYVSNDIRIGVLVEIFLRLAQDPSKLVKQSILQQSGIFISTLPPKFVNEVILGHYCSMAYEPTGDMTVDAELKHHCAFSFPAVLLTIGSSRWKEIRDVYHSLVQSRSVIVKQTLAASLHEIAKILSNGNDLEEELVPIFEEMIQDAEEVQIGVIKNLAVFLGLLSEPCRISYLPVLHDILHSTNPFNWRLRQALALQLPELIDLPPKKDVFSMLFPLVMILLQDPVADVRKDSFKGVAKLINVLYEQSKLELIQSENEINSNGEQIQKHATHDLETVIRGVNALVRGETYQIRELWIEVCHRLLRELPRELFEKSFIEGILKLTSDPVSNVRVAVAIMLTGWEPEDHAPWESRTNSRNSNSNSNGNLNSSNSIDNENENENSNGELVTFASSNSSNSPSPTSALTPNATSVEASITSTSVSSKSNSAYRNRPSPYSWLLQRPDIKECIQRLRQDDQDVYYNVLKLQPLFPDLVFEKMSCRGIKSAPGGSVPVVYSGTTVEVPIPLDIEEELEQRDSIYSPGKAGLDLSDSSAAHIHYPAAHGLGHNNASSAMATSNRVFPPPTDMLLAEGENSLAGFEEFMETLDMGNVH